ncbi:MAG: DUF1232 domain-containing protein [Epsilonproteobacteria bacterium]|nr:DUF1232 domain-containing protein [Campylobacterota bacterium]
MSEIPQINTVEYSEMFDQQKSEAFIQTHEKKRWYDDFKLLFHMVKDQSFSMNSSSYLTITGALAYVVLPTDVVPDFLPGVGWVDDALILKLVVDSTKTEIQRYKAFIKQRG